MARTIKVREMDRDEELGIIRKEISLPNVLFETPSASLKNIRRKIYPTTLTVNEITRRINQDVVDGLEEEGTAPFVKRIRSNFLSDKLNLTIFDLTFDSIPSPTCLRTLSQTLYASSDTTIFLPTVKSGLLKEDRRLSVDRIRHYLEMMRCIIDEIESVGNKKEFIGTIPLMPIKFSRPIIEFYHDKGIQAFAIDAGTKDVILNEGDFRLILSEINHESPLEQDFIYACNLGYSQFEEEEIRADDFLSIFAYVDVLGCTFKARGGGARMKGAKPRAKMFSRTRYSYKITNYAKASEIIGKELSYSTLRDHNRCEQLRETDKVRFLVGQEKMKNYLGKKVAVDRLAMKRLESIAKKLEMRLD